MSVDTRALDEAVRRFPLLIRHAHIFGIRQMGTFGIRQMGAELWAEMLRSSIIREYRLILAKERAAQ